MNQGRIWCVVHPTVGLPLLLGAVSLTSLAVHTAVMTHTTWMGNYWSGAARSRVSESAAPQAAPAAALASGFSVTVTPVAAADGTSPTSFVIALAPNPAAAALRAGVSQSADPGTVPRRTVSAN